MSEEDAGTSAVGITDYELAALVDMNTTPQGRRVLEAVGIDALLEEPTALRAGYATLLVREIAGLDDAGIVADGFGAAIGTMVSSADDILRVVLTHDGDVFGRSVLVDADAGSFLLDMTTYGVHAAQPLRRDADLIELVADVIATMAEEDGPGLPFDVEVTRFPLEAEPRHAELTIEDADSWRLADADAARRAATWERVREILGVSDGEAARMPRRAHS